MAMTINVNNNNNVINVMNDNTIIASFDMTSDNYNMRRRVPISLLQPYDCYSSICAAISDIRANDQRHEQNRAARRTGRTTNRTARQTQTTQVGRTIGVEIETILPSGKSPSELARYLTDGGVLTKYESYNHNVRSCWKIIHDGSLPNNGWEIVSPPMVNLADLEKVCNMLQTFGCKINKSCGLHVHVDACEQGTSKTVGEKLALAKAVAYLYEDNYELMNSIQPASRRSSHWCKPYNGRIDTVAEWIATSRYESRGNYRYHAINMLPVKSYGTIEFRQHSGTIEFNKMKAWIEVCKAYVHTCEHVVSNPRCKFMNLEGLMNFLALSDETKQAMKARQTKFRR